MSRQIFTILSPELVPLYDMEDTLVVVIDVLRATSTIAALIDMGVNKVIPVSSVSRCIELGKEIDCITAGERNGQVIEGLDKGNSPLAFTSEELLYRTVALTTTNGTMLLNELLLHNAKHIVTGAFVNIGVLCDFILTSDKDVLLACAGWKGLVNCEDTLFAGAVVDRLRSHFSSICDSSIMACEFYNSSQRYKSIYDFMLEQKTSHFERLIRVGHQQDLKVCCEIDRFPALPVYLDGALVKANI